MTLPPMPDAATDPRTRLAHDVAAATAAVLPSSAEPSAGLSAGLTAGEAQPGTEHIASLFAIAVSAPFTGPVTGTVTLLLGEELVELLQTGRPGQLDVATAVQPALDAAAASLGSAAGAGTETPLDTVVERQGGYFTVVPFLGAGIAGALLVPDVTLDAALRVASAAAAGGVTSSMDDLRPGAIDPVSSGATSPPTGSPVAAPPGGATVHPITTGRGGIGMLHGVEMEVTVELGRTRMSVRELLALAPGTVLALDRAAGAPADLLVNGRLVARGEVVVVGEDFGLRVTEILDQPAAV